MNRADALDKGSDGGVVDVESVIPAAIDLIQPATVSQKYTASSA